MGIRNVLVDDLGAEVEPGSGRHLRLLAGMWEDASLLMSEAIQHTPADIAPVAVETKRGEPAAHAALRRAQAIAEGLAAQALELDPPPEPSTEEPEPEAGPAPTTTGAA